MKVFFVYAPVMYMQEIHAENSIEARDKFIEAYNDAPANTTLGDMSEDYIVVEEIEEETAEQAAFYETLNERLDARQNELEHGL